MTLSNGQWRTIIGVAVAVVSFLLIQTEVQLDPLAKLILGCLNVGLAVINVPDGGTTADG